MLDFKAPCILSILYDDEDEQEEDIKEVKVQCSLIVQCIVEIKKKRRSRRTLRGKRKEF